MKLRGLSLLETLISIGILLTGLVGILSVFQAGLVHGSRSQRQLELSYQGRHLIRQRLIQLQEATLFQQLTPGAGPWQTGTNGLSFRWTVMPQTLYSPSEGLEQAYPLEQQKVLHKSALRLQLDLRQEDTQLQLQSAVIEPLRQWSNSQPLTMTSSGNNPLGKGQVLKFAAKCNGADGRALDDLMISWSVVPVTGVATLEEVARDGHSAQLRNITRRKNGSVYYTGGSCYVVAQACYNSQMREARSSLITLSGP